MVKFLLLSFILFPTLLLAVNDKQLLTEAREQYANGHIKKAIQLYSQIQPESDFWLESIEERAWSWTRLNELENALADLHSITSPVWSSQVGPETYMLSSYVSLKMCNYKDVLQKMNLFKRRMLFRVEALEKLSQQPLSKGFLKLIPEIKKLNINLVLLGNTAELYPRYFFRDLKLIQALQQNRMSLAANRLKELAKADLKEIENNLKKMKIIEVEMMQAVLMKEGPSSNEEKLEFSSVNRNEKLIFPITDNEVWIDEVGQYQVRAQKCPSPQKRTL